ncbi:F-box only protein 3 [Rhinolophus ferrumequinum]|uniref:F-box protein 3 n=1 Tax=Rhinolophus ferrumequinum TaxID=59479 RepID=A0A671EAM9_RHIFE|nr:F-box only protein 3 [Rhinolophus ferrumequinum]
MAAMDVVSAPLTLELLPTDTLLLILSFLDYQDLINCCYVSRRLHQLASHDPLWRRHCKKYWLISEEEKAQKNQCWKSLFIDTYSDVGRYIDHYAAIKKAWADLRKYLEPRPPQMALSLQGDSPTAPGSLMPQEIP